MRVKIRCAAIASNLKARTMFFNEKWIRDNRWTLISVRRTSQNWSAVNLVVDFRLRNNRIVTRTGPILFFIFHDGHELLRKEGNEPRSVEILKLMFILGNSCSLMESIFYCIRESFQSISMHCSFTCIFTAFTPSRSLIRVHKWKNCFSIHLSRRIFDRQKFHHRLPISKDVHVHDFIRCCVHTHVSA